MFNFVTRWFKSMQRHPADAGEHKEIENQDSTSHVEEKSTLFSYPSNEEDAQHFHDIIGIIQHTPSGRWLLYHLGQEIQNQPIPLRFANSARMKDNLGYVDNGMIFLKSIDLKKVPANKKQRVLLQEACVMVHELEHIWQDNMEQKYNESSPLPILYDIYLRLLSEATAYARELFFSEELKIKYPMVTRGLPLLCNGYRSETKLITKFLDNKKPYRLAEEYIDEILSDLCDPQFVEMNSESKAEMIKRADHILETSICSLKYKDIPLERMRGFKSLKNGYAIKGHNMYLEMNKQGHLVLLVDGCHKSVEERSISLFEAPQTYRHSSGKNIARQKRRELVKEDISVQKKTDVLGRVTWSRPVRGADNRIEQLLTSKNFEKVLNPQYRHRAYRAYHAYRGR